jgi:hypothetical protein
MSDRNAPQPGDDCTPQPTTDERQAAADSTDEKAPDKLALRASQAGMRFIAQMTIYNSGNDERLAQFIEQAYHPQLLQAQPVESRVQVFRTTRERLGRLKVKQVVATSEHQSIVVMETEQTDDYFMMQMQVEDDYPHRITAYMHQPLQPVQSDAADSEDT